MYVRREGECKDIQRYLMEFIEQRSRHMTQILVDTYESESVFIQRGRSSGNKQQMNRYFQIYNEWISDCHHRRQDLFLRRA